MPASVTSGPVRDFVSRLLVADPALRLGSGRTGTSDVMAHAFFSGLDWTALQAGEVPPPLLPSPGSDLIKCFPRRANLDFAASTKHDGGPALDEFDVF